MAEGLLLAKGATGFSGVRVLPVDCSQLGRSRMLAFRPFQFMEQRRNLQVRRLEVITKAFLPVDPWAPGNAIDSQSIASGLFAASLFPYLGFLYHLTKSKTAPPLTLFGFYFLLVFVGATIPAGIYAKLHYGTSLSNVDWLHGGAESMLTLTNIFIVFGLRRALRNAKQRVEQGENLPLSK